MKDRKNIREKTRRRFTVTLERTEHLKLHVPSKTYSLDYNSTSDYMRIPPRTGLESWLTVKKSVISPILSPTLLQIYCIGLIEPISISYWVWATICDLTVCIYLFRCVCMHKFVFVCGYVKSTICSRKVLCGHVIRRLFSGFSLCVLHVCQ